MAIITMTESLAHSIAQDEGNRNMIKARRKKWNQTDYNSAVRKFDVLWPIQKEGICS